MRFGLLMSKVTTPLIMGIVFFLVISPIGLVAPADAGTTRWRGNFDAQAGSYRVPSRQNPSNDLERPF